MPDDVESACNRFPGIKNQYVDTEINFLWQVLWEISIVMEISIVIDTHVKRQFWG